MSQDSSFTTRQAKVLSFQDAKDITRIEGVIIDALRPKILKHEFLYFQRELYEETDSSRTRQSSNLWRLREIVDDVVTLRLGSIKPRPGNIVDELSEEEELFYDLLHYAAMYQCVYAHANLLGEKWQRHYTLRLFCVQDSLIDRLSMTQEIVFTDERLAAQYKDLQQRAPEALAYIARNVAALQPQPAQRQSSLRMILASRWHRLREKSP